MSASEGDRTGSQLPEDSELSDSQVDRLCGWVDGLVTDPDFVLPEDFEFSAEEAAIIAARVLGRVESIDTVPVDSDVDDTADDSGEDRGAELLQALGLAGLFPARPTKIAARFPTYNTKQEEK